MRSGCSVRFTSRSVNRKGGAGDRHSGGSSEISLMLNDESGEGHEKENGLNNTGDCQARYQWEGAEK